MSDKPPDKRTTRHIREPRKNDWRKGKMQICPVCGLEVYLRSNLMQHLTAKHAEYLPIALEPNDDQR